MVYYLCKSEQPGCYELATVGGDDKLVCSLDKIKQMATEGHVIYGYDNGDITCVYDDFDSFVESQKVFMALSGVNSDKIEFDTDRNRIRLLDCISDVDNSESNIPDFVSDLIIGVHETTCAFRKLYILHNLHIPEGVRRISAPSRGVLAMYPATLSLQLQELVIPSSVKVLGDGAFQTPFNKPNNTLGNLIFKCDIDTIPMECFENCNIHEIVWPQRVSCIDEKAFQGAVLAKEFHIPSTVTRIKKNAFTTAKGIQHLYFDGEITLHSDAFSASTVNHVHFGETYLHLKWYKQQFDGCKSLETVEYTTHCDKVSEEMFFNCTFLRKVTNMKRVSSFEQRCFYGCSLLPEIDFGWVSKIGCGAFEKSGLRHIDISFVECRDGVAEEHGVCDSAFESCERLETVKLSGHIERLGRSAFARSCKLRSANLAASHISTVASKAFQGCSALQEIQLPDCLRHIKDYAFAGTGLKSIVLPNYLVSIGVSAFENTPLTEVWMPRKDCDIDPLAFGLIDQLDKILFHVYDGSSAMAWCIANGARYEVIAV